MDAGHIMKSLRIAEFCNVMNLSKDWVYTEIKAGRLPLVTFCGEPVRPWQIDLDKALSLFSSTQANIIPINRSLKTEKQDESVNRKPVTKEDLWKD